ncbi:MAG: extracellular metalloprotease M10 family [Parcubacteria bacterium C7867-001]|nr:MAG: extracellular metalloprotease M10 family [Parcubacteria bacterium C7867-001]
MNAVKAGIEYVLVLSVLGATGYFLYTKAVPLLTPPCSTSVEYSIGSIDPRYGLSTSTLVSYLKEAEAPWNKAAGKTVATYMETGSLKVNLVYSEQQAATSLGKNIDADQKVYVAAKASLESLRRAFEQQKNAYEAAVASFNAASEAYSAEVAKWNARGGAPKEIFQQLENQKRSLEARQASLARDAADINSLVTKINQGVTALNAAAKKINAKVSTYNSAVGDDFDQGDYVSDAQGKRINVFEFTKAADLKRVLEHELGHAIGLGHVENPASIMYSYNVGSGLALTEEDVAELKAVCKIKS